MKVNDYAVLAKQGRTWGSHAGVMRMARELANRIAKKGEVDGPVDRAWTLETIAPYFEIVEFEAVERRIVTE